MIALSSRVLVHLQHTTQKTGQFHHTMALRARLLAMAFISVSLFINSTSAESARFKDWYPRYRPALNSIIRNNCSREYQAFLDKRDDYFVDDPQIAIWKEESHGGPVVQCILAASPEIIKASIASAQVLLGLMPTMLASLGPSVQDTAILTVVAKRPVLSFLLALGSPAKFVDRGFRYGGTIDEFKTRGDGLAPGSPKLGAGFLVDAVEHVVALAAVANVAHLSWELSYRVSYTFSQDDQYHAALWAFIGASIHIFGILGLYLRVAAVKQNAVAERSHISDERGRKKAFLHRAKNFFTPLHSDEYIRVQLRPPTLAYGSLALFTSILTACHVIYGTLVFSSVLFISIKDAVYVILRYIASSIFCRVIAEYEVAVLKHRMRNQGVERARSGDVQEDGEARKGSALNGR